MNCVNSLVSSLETTLFGAGRTGAAEAVEAKKYSLTTLNSCCGDIDGYHRRKEVGEILRKGVMACVRVAPILIVHEYTDSDRRDRINNVEVYSNANSDAN